MKLIDAESTLVSKAIHAPQKNKQLIRQAIAIDKFPDLVDRIIHLNPNGHINLTDAIWAGRYIEPRILEVLPAAYERFKMKEKCPKLFDLNQRQWIS